MGYQYILVEKAKGYSFGNPCFGGSQQTGRLSSSQHVISIMNRAHGLVQAACLSVKAMVHDDGGLLGTDLHSSRSG